MRGECNIPETKREFIREKRRHLKAIKKHWEELRSGCGIQRAFSGKGLVGDEYRDAVYAMEESIDAVDMITKKLR